MIDIMLVTMLVMGVSYMILAFILGVRKYVDEETMKGDIEDYD